MMGSIAGRYEVERPLGAGAFARTLLAFDRDTGDRVALKVLHEQVDLKAWELFEREAVVLGSLRHSGIPLIHDVLRGEWEGRSCAFIVMEYIEGESLAALIGAGRRFDSAEVIRLFEELLGVLAYLHSRVPPVLHRDIKPANIILRQGGNPVLVDFGAARNRFRAPDESGSSIVGTYGYMPYEQYMGQALPASDLYSLAATFLHLVTGRAPQEFFGDDGAIAVPGDLPCGEPLRTILARLLAHAPSARYQGAWEVITVLRRGGTGALVPSAPASRALAERRGAPAAVLTEGPRRIEGELRELYRRLAPGTWRLMNTGVRPGGGTDLVTIGLTVFFGVITIGIMPAIFISLATARRRRVRAFLERGVAASARILDMSQEDIAFGEKMIRVRYEFEAEGRLRRGSDHALPPVAEQWEKGEEIAILYLPERGYDSIIVSTQ
jgi:hypothetical protein